MIKYEVEMNIKCPGSIQGKQLSIIWRATGELMRHLHNIEDGFKKKKKKLVASRTQAVWMGQTNAKN